MIENMSSAYGAVSSCALRQKNGFGKTFFTPLCHKVIPKSALQ